MYRGISHLRSTSARALTPTRSSRASSPSALRTPAGLTAWPQIGGYNPRTYHCTVLERYGLLPFYDVGRTGFTVYLLELHTVRTKPGAFHLFGYHVACEAYYAYVMAGRGLHSHYVADFEPYIRSVAVEPLTRILETHLEDVPLACLRYIGQPVVFAQLIASAARFSRCVFWSIAVTKSATASYVRFIFFHYDRYELIIRLQGLYTAYTDTFHGITYPRGDTKV